MRGMLANIGHIQNQIGKELMLHFEAPVFDHARASIGWIDVLRPREIQLRRIQVGRRCERGKSCIKTKGRREVVQRGKSWVTLESGAVEATEIRIDQGTIENS